MSVKAYYYMDDSFLLEEDAYLMVEELLAREPELCFLLDTAIHARVADYRNLGRESDALALENFVKLFTALGNTLQVDTGDGFRYDALTPMAAEKLVIVTQQQKLVDNFAPLGDGVQFLRFHEGALAPFPHGVDENGKAFYLEKDVYVNAFDIKELTYVYSPRYGYLKLDKSKEYSGGEGVCYRTYNGLFCKLYFKKHISYVNFKKLQAMAEMGCDNPFISWPLDILYYRNQFVGYLMKELSAMQSVDELRDDGFSEFRLIDRFLIVRNFLRNVHYLHERDILVGDMKLDNILVAKNCDVHIIDAGSFQVEDYACTVCHKEYTERIYTGDQLKRILRSVREEYFPINKIIFEILMLKGPFYSKDNTEIDGDGSRDFTYPPEFDPNTMDPKTLPYHMKVWFSLSPAMRRYFYYYFTEGKVTYLSEWLRELDVYILSKERAAQKNA
ncbi:MAG: hypothetical protein E7624_05435 [Ruminococcaceae bacterium]|nr:hypothetical protein [Oscillospiraceae bacterium]